MFENSETLVYSEVVIVLKSTSVLVYSMLVVTEVLNFYVILSYLLCKMDILKPIVSFSCLVRKFTLRGLSQVQKHRHSIYIMFRVAQKVTKQDIFLDTVLQSKYILFKS